jgi:hypothetical protein
MHDTFPVGRGLQTLSVRHRANAPTMASMGFVPVHKSLQWQAALLIIIFSYLHFISFIIQKEQRD